MIEGSALDQHINVFNQIISDLNQVDVKFEEEDMNWILYLRSSSRDHLMYSWIMDSACSYHMTPNKDWFDTYRLVNTGFVLMGNDASCKVVRMWNIIVKMFDGVIKALCDVRHVPNLRKNMISLRTLTAMVLVTNLPIE